MELNTRAMIALIAGLVFIPSAFSQTPATGGATPSPPGATVEFVDLKDGPIIGPKTTGVTPFSSFSGTPFHIPHQPPVYSDPIVVYVGMSPPVRRHHRPRHHHAA